MGSWSLIHHDSRWPHSVGSQGHLSVSCPSADSIIGNSPLNSLGHCGFVAKLIDEPALVVVHGLMNLAAIYAP